MDKLEQKLREYNENNPVQISEAFLEKLMALEPRPAAEKPRRRYVLPIAAAAALALAIGGWFAWRHAAMPEPAQSPIAIQSAPANAVADPAEPSKREETPQPETAEQNPQSPAAHVSEGSVTLTKPEASQSTGSPAPARSDAATPAKAEETAPEKPENTTPSEPEDAPAAKPEDTAPAKPDEETPGTPAVDPPAKPDDEQPGTPDDPTPAEPDAPPPADPVDPNPQTPEGPDSPVVTPPPDDPPYVTMEKNGINASYRTGDDGESMTFTLMSTGESIVVDVTGWMDELPDDPQPGGAQAVSGSTYTGFCTAFDRIIVYYLIRNEDETVRIELDVIELKKETEQRKEGDYET